MSKTILAVDDEKHIVRLVQINLEKAGYRVVTAGNGQEALDAVRAHRPDLVVMDVMMPVMDGFEALKRLKNDAQTSHVPVIMLTAKAQDSDVFRGWQSGADLYLTKPFVPQELLSFVRRIFDAQQQAQREDAAFEVREEAHEVVSLDHLEAATLSNEDALSEPGVFEVVDNLDNIDEVEIFQGTPGFDWSLSEADAPTQEKDPGR